MKFLLSPEASNWNRLHAALVRPAWIGPVKALFWVAFSIASGVALAILCS
ncbi:MAG: hypothetical protein R6X32_16235 [Chloroflexota bacterium]